MRILLRIILILFISVQCSRTVCAQDIHFSQFFNSPLTLSPSNTGNIQGDFRVCGNYRSQWKEIAKPYLTQSISLDKQFYLHRERISAGLVVFNDQSGGHLKVNKFLFSSAYHKTLGGHNLHAGLQIGYVIKSFSLKDETFPNQMNWDNGKYDAQLPNYETGLDEHTSNLDLNAGIGWNKKITNKIEPFFSFAIFHSHFQKETFFDNGKNQLKPRSLMNVGAVFQVTKRVGIVPDLLLMNTVKASELLIGTNVEYTLSEGENVNKRKAVYLGGFARNNTQIKTDASYLVAGLKYNNWNTAISYDVNVSTLHTATNYRGAFEFSFIYTGISTRLTKTEIPCDRY
jgi:type IX secretion system PorP/SprF family membrane protein